MNRAEQKAATREKILDLAAERLRREGMGGNAVHRLMRDAGLTHGGFYVHFESKEALDIAALERAMEKKGYLEGSQMATAFNLLRSGEPTLVEL